MARGLRPGERDADPAVSEVATAGAVVQAPVAVTQRIVLPGRTWRHLAGVFDGSRRIRKYDHLIKSGVYFVLYIADRVRLCYTVAGLPGRCCVLVLGYAQLW